MRRAECDRAAPGLEVLGCHLLAIARPPRTGAVESAALHGKQRSTRDTEWAMSEENVEALKRGFEAVSRLDAEAMLEMADPGIEFRPRFQVMLGGEAAVY